MWIKFLYCDHGHSQKFKELEIPDCKDVKEVKKNYGSVESFICELNLVPHWSERFLTCRIKWKRIKNPKKKTVLEEINNLKAGLLWRAKKLTDLKRKYKHILDN